ncbi:uncharacterized protein LOC116619421 isoform X2 [Nematostella vectensis]|uniref:uncharacterized protein LOC116619421 isoform X2 n=1 Tax=Nematostella vectensis TaxID=45351 RepID=UPI00139035C7|nr:uncharacterized protein LOC116619421 isoform X2 [Nematostella vectensis]
MMRVFSLLFIIQMTPLARNDVISTTTRHLSVTVTSSWQQAPQDMTNSSVPLGIYPTTSVVMATVLEKSSDATMIHRSTILLDKTSTTTAYSVTRAVIDKSIYTTTFDKFETATLLSGTEKTLLDRSTLAVTPEVSTKDSTRQTIKLNDTAIAYSNGGPTATLSLYSYYHSLPNGLSLQTRSVESIDTTAGLKTWAIRGTATYSPPPSLSSSSLSWSIFSQSPVTLKVSSMTSPVMTQEPLETLVAMEILMPDKEDAVSRDKLEASLVKWYMRGSGLLSRRRRSDMSDNAINTDDSGKVGRTRRQGRAVEEIQAKILSYLRVPTNHSDLLQIRFQVYRDGLALHASDIVRVLGALSENEIKGIMGYVVIKAPYPVWTLLSSTPTITPTPTVTPTPTPTVSLSTHILVVAVAVPILFLISLPCLLVNMSCCCSCKPKRDQSGIMRRGTNKSKSSQKERSKNFVNNCRTNTFERTGDNSEDGLLPRSRASPAILIRGHTDSRNKRINRSRGLNHSPLPSLGPSTKMDQVNHFPLPSLGPSTKMDQVNHSPLPSLGPNTTMDQVNHSLSPTQGLEKTTMKQETDKSVLIRTTEEQGSDKKSETCVDPILLPLQELDETDKQQTSNDWTSQSQVLQNMMTHSAAVVEKQARVCNKTLPPIITPLTFERDVEDDVDDDVTPHMRMIAKLEAEKDRKKSRQRIIRLSSWRETKKPSEDSLRKILSRKTRWKTQDTTIKNDVTRGTPSSPYSPHASREWGMCEHVTHTCKHVSSTWCDPQGFPPSSRGPGHEVHSKYGRHLTGIGNPVSPHSRMTEKRSSDYSNPVYMSSEMTSMEMSALPPVQVFEPAMWYGLPGHGCNVEQVNTNADALSLCKLSSSFDSYFVVPGNGTEHSSDKAVAVDKFNVGSFEEKLHRDSSALENREDPQLGTSLLSVSGHELEVTLRRTEDEAMQLVNNVLARAHSAHY